MLSLNHAVNIPTKVLVCLLLWGSQTVLTAQSLDIPRQKDQRIHQTLALSLPGDLFPNQEGTIHLKSQGEVLVYGFLRVDSDHILILGSFQGTLRVAGENLKATMPTLFAVSLNSWGELNWLRPVAAQLLNSQVGPMPIIEDDVPVDDPDGIGPDGD